MEWIFIAPHLDDVVLSCGGLLRDLNQQGDSTSVWTICAGDPPEGSLSPLAEMLHQRWGTGRSAARLRREEDIVACKKVGAAYRHFSVPDCIYRRDPTNHAPLYHSEKDIFGPLAQADEALIERLSIDLVAEFKPNIRIVSPLAIGDHVDHRLVRQALEKTSYLWWYYADNH